MREGVLPEPDAGRPQNSAPGGVAAQVPHLQSIVQPEVQSEDAPFDAHRAPLGVRRLRAVLRELRRPEGARGPAPLHVDHPRPRPPARLGLDHHAKVLVRAEGEGRGGRARRGQHEEALGLQHRRHYEAINCRTRFFLGLNVNFF